MILPFASGCSRVVRNPAQLSRCSRRTRKARPSCPAKLRVNRLSLCPPDNRRSPADEALGNAPRRSRRPPVSNPIRNVPPCALRRSGRGTADRIGQSARARPSEQRTGPPLAASVLAVRSPTESLDSTAIEHSSRAGTGYRLPPLEVELKKRETSASLTSSTLRSRRLGVVVLTIPRPISNHSTCPHRKELEWPNE